MLESNISCTCLFVCGYLEIQRTKELEETRDGTSEKDRYITIIMVQF